MKINARGSRVVNLRFCMKRWSLYSATASACGAVHIPSSEKTELAMVKQFSKKWSVPASAEMCTRDNYIFCLSVWSCWQCNANRRWQNAFRFLHHNGNARVGGTGRAHVPRPSDFFWETCPPIFKFRILIK